MTTTIYDVAKLAKVSISTVSRVLNNASYVSEESKNKVLDAVEKLNFKKNMVAAALMKKQTSTFGLIIPDIKNLFYANITRGVEDVANELGFNVILCNTDYDMHKERMYIDFLLQKGIDGIIFSTPEIRDKNVKDLIESNPQLPVVILGSKVEGVIADEILVDNFEGGYLSTKHLLELGHQRIGFVSGGRYTLATIERQKGYERALKDNGVQITSELIIMDEFKANSGYKNALKLLSKDRPTAIFAGNDLIAVGVYRAARELGLNIPEDLSVVGFDDTEYAQILTPMLTTIHSPIQEMGSRAMRFAIMNLQGKKTAKETVVFRPTLVKRESTAYLKR
ncbi:MAG: LacI family DNA-binding transcriptional regulator [Desulfitobacteriaceae bacterium]